MSVVFPKRLFFAMLYMSEGAPIGFLWWALPTLLRARGVAVESISLLVSLLAIPWALKFLWAPAVDLRRSVRWGTRGWILASQLLMGLTLLPLAWLDWTADFALVVTFLVMHAFAASTQDVSIDALCIRSTSEQERGVINGWMQAGMLVGRSVFGGTTLILVDVLGTSGMVFLLVGTLWMVSLAVLAFDKRDETESVAPSLSDYRARIMSVLRKRTTWLGLLFAGIGGAAFEGVGSVAGPFLIDAGYATSSVGFFFAVPSVLAMMLGALGGGWIADAMERTKAVRLTLLGVVLIVLGLSLHAGLGDASNPAITLPLLAALYLAIGLFTASSYALFMDLSDRSLGATQFSAYMAATNGCEAWSAFAVGRLVGPFGYPVAFLLLAAVSVSSLPIIGKLKDMSPAK